MAWIDSDTIDIDDLAADSVTVESWVHSGPISVSLKGVPVRYLLDRVDPKYLREYLTKQSGKVEELG